MKGASKATAPFRRSTKGGGAKISESGASGRFMTRGFQFGMVTVLLLAPLLALGIQLARAPDEVPAVESLVKPRPLGSLIVGSLANPQPTTLEFTLDEINTHLAQVLPPVIKKDGSWSFQKVSLQLESERAHLRAIYRWHGVELHLRVSYMVTLQGGKLQVRPFQATFGRVQLGVYWTRKMQDNFLSKLLPALKKEQILMNRLETLRLEPGRALLKVRASTAPPSR